MGTLVAERSLRVFGPPYEEFRQGADRLLPGAVPAGSALIWWLRDGDSQRMMRLKVTKPC